MTARLTERWPVLHNWKFFLVIFLPLVLLPVLFIEDNDLLDEGTDEERRSTKFRCAYVIVIMAVFWMVEAIPLAATSFLPIVLFPLLGIQDTYLTQAEAAKITTTYMSETNMMFVGGLIIALAVEFCNLHKRIAIKVMTIVGTSPIRLMLGMMLTTMFLAMFISNTATTAMMVPIVLAVQDVLKEDPDDVEENNVVASVSKTRTSIASNGKNGTENNAPIQNTTKSSHGLLLAVAYAANLGGTGFVTGTAPNLILIGRLKDNDITQDGKYTALSFVTWMAYSVPGMLINVAVAWVYLALVFFGIPDWARFGKKNSSDLQVKADASENISKLLKQKYKDLGPMTFHEKAVSILFFFIVMLWLFRDPRFIKGWSEYIPHVEVGDSTAAMLVIVLLFVVPRNLNFFSGGSSETLLDWKFVQDRLSWGIFFLMGAGFALSDASDASGLSPWIGEQLKGLEHLDKRLILIIVMLLITTINEVASNTATANIIIPILLNLSKNLKIHPLYLTLPATISCSYAFMLPVATPPNAIVFGAGNMKIIDMIKTGLFCNFSCVIVCYILNISYANLIFDFDNYEYPAENMTTPSPSTTLIY